MSDISNTKIVKARAAYSCLVCHQQIPRGMLHTNVRGRYEGDWQNWRAHTACVAIYHAVTANGDPVPDDIEGPEMLAGAEKAGVLADFLLYWKMPEIDDWKSHGFGPPGGLKAHLLGFYQRARAQIAESYFPVASPDVKPMAIAIMKIPLPECLEGALPCRKCGGAIDRRRIRVTSEKGKGVYHNECFIEMLHAHKFGRHEWRMILEPVPAPNQPEPATLEIP